MTHIGPDPDNLPLSIAVALYGLWQLVLAFRYYRKTFK